MFEIVSPSDDINTELRAKRRRDIKSVDGAELLVEIEQGAPVIHIHRRVKGISGSTTTSSVSRRSWSLEAIGMEIPLSEIYDRLFKGSEPAGEA